MAKEDRNNPFNWILCEADDLDALKAKIELVKEEQIPRNLGLVSEEISAKILLAKDGRKRYLHGMEIVAMDSACRYQGPILPELHKYFTNIFGIDAIGELEKDTYISFSTKRIGKNDSAVEIKWKQRGETKAIIKINNNGDCSFLTPGELGMSITALKTDESETQNNVVGLVLLVGQDLFETDKNVLKGLEKDIDNWNLYQEEIKEREEELGDLVYGLIEKIPIDYDQLIRPNSICTEEILPLASEEPGLIALFGEVLYRLGLIDPEQKTELLKLLAWEMICLTISDRDKPYPEIGMAVYGGITPENYIDNELIRLEIESGGETRLAASKKCRDTINFGEIEGWNPEAIQAMYYFLTALNYSAIARGIISTTEE